MKWKGVPTNALTRDLRYYSLKIMTPLDVKVFRDRLVLSKHQLLHAKDHKAFMLDTIAHSVRAVIYQTLREENLDEDEVNLLVTIQKQPPSPEYGEVAYDSTVVRVYEDKEES